MGGTWRAREVSLKAPVRQRASRRAPGLPAAALLLLLAAQAGGEAPPGDAADAERELSRISTAIGALERDIRAARADRTQASLALERHERAIADIAREQRRLEATAADLDRELARLRTVRDGLERDVSAERAALGRQLRVAYALGRQHPVRLLLQDRDPGTVARLLRYHGYLTRERRARIAALDSALERLAGTEAAIDRESRRLAEVRARQAERREALLAERERRAGALARLVRELHERTAELGAMRQDRERLAELVKRLREAINDIPPELEPPRSFASLRGKLPWPVQGTLSRRFGAPREEAGLTWQGVMMRAKAGGEVRAVAHGRVVFADWLRGFGMMVILDHGDGYMTLYGHNQSLLREPGEWVAAGDPVATVGDSGGSASAGLYFEIRRDGRPVDPDRWCSARARFRAAL